jgi:hypothetical protein
MGTDDGAFPSLVQLCYTGLLAFSPRFPFSIPDTSVQLSSKTSIVRSSCRHIRQTRYLTLTHTEISSLGDLSYDLARPILEHCSAEQLDELEGHYSESQKV